MKEVDHSSKRNANLRLLRVLSLLNRALVELQAARRSSADRHHRNKLNNIAVSLREVTLPLSHIVPDGRCER